MVQRIAICCSDASFGLSAAAVRRLRELGSSDAAEIELWSEVTDTTGLIDLPGLIETDQHYWPGRRDDPLLLQVLEEMGQDAWGGLVKAGNSWDRWADDEPPSPGYIKIVEIPDDIKWHVRASDFGPESVVEDHRRWS